MNSSHLDRPEAGSLVDQHTPARLANQRLRNTLRCNAVTSSLGGVAALAGGNVIADLLGVDEVAAVRAIGAGLIVFAAAVAWLAGARVRQLFRLSPLITAADVVWVLATLATIAAGWYRAAGVVVLAIVGSTVGLLAARQWFSLRRSRSLAVGYVDAIDENPPDEVVHVERVLAADVATVWGIITDHELYGHLAPNLSRVEAIAENGPGLQRSCANRKGATWHETCTLWDGQHRFEIAVDTSNYPYPLAIMRGAWSVVPTGDGRSLVAMDFRFRPRATISGRAFAAALHGAFPLVLRRILRGWEGEAAARSAAGANQKSA